MSEDKTTRAYAYADVIMLTAAYAQVENAIVHKDRILQDRPKWDLAFYNALKTRIDDAIKTYIGRDNAKALRDATREVVQQLSEALTKLGLFKKQIEIDFDETPAEKEEMLNNLGFSALYTSASKNKNQADMVTLLQRFEKSMTADIKADLVNKGMNGTLVDEILALTTQLTASSLTQEVFKLQKPARSAEAVAEFNKIYKEVIRVVKMSRQIFVKDKVIYDSFSFSATAKAQTAFRKSQSKEKDKPDTAATSA
jgi:hypothetical protein